MQSDTNNIPSGDWTLSFWTFVDTSTFGEDDRILGLVNQWDEDDANIEGLQINYVWENEGPRLRF